VKKKRRKRTKSRVKRQKKQLAIVENRRPLVLTVLCSVSIFTSGVQLLTSFMPGIYAGLLVQVPHLYLVFLLAFFYPASIAGSAGIWMMRRWGVYLYAAVVGLAALVQVYYRHLPNIGGFLFSALFLGSALVYFRRMQ